MIVFLPVWQWMNGKVKWICSRFELGAELSGLAPDLCCNYAPAFSLWKNANAARGAILKDFGLNSHFQLFSPWLIYPVLQPILTTTQFPHPLWACAFLLLCLISHNIHSLWAETEWLALYCFHRVLLYFKGHFPLGRMRVVFTTVPLPTNPTICLISTCSGDEDSHGTLT